VYTLIILFLLWLATNAAHTAWVETRRFFWESRLTRRPDGLLPDAAAFRVGDGPLAVLFIHGFADTPRVWQRMAKRLAAKGPFACHAMRLAGSAEPAARAKKQSLRIWRAQVADEIARLRETHPAVWLAGHSMGGALVLDAALRHPDPVAGVAVFAPLIDVSRKQSPLLPPDVWFRIARIALCLSPTFESPFSADGVASDDPSFTYKRDRFIPFCVYLSLFELIRSNRAQAGRLQKPVFAVTSGRDSVVDTAAALRWLAGCPGPKEIRNLPDAGHVIPLEPGWESLTDDLAAFIQKSTSIGKKT